MIPGSFDYHAPSTLDEAVALLDKFGDDAKVLAGGQSLIPMMKLRLAEPPQLIDINGIGDLSYIKEEDGWLAIGEAPRLAGFGGTPEEARADYERLQDVHRKCLERNRANRPGRILRTARDVLAEPETQ